jgi:hypothetical protein
MAGTGREIYLISDLHLGGVQPTTAGPDDRGFRICTRGHDVAASSQRSHRSRSRSS